MVKLVILYFTLVLGVFPLPAWGQNSRSSTELIQYVRDARKAGQPDLQILQNANKAGWSEQEIKTVLDSLRTTAAQPGPQGPAVSGVASGEPQPDHAAAGSAIQIPAVSLGATAGLNQGATPPKPQVPDSNLPKDTTSPKTVAPNKTLVDEYRIGEGDVLQINVWGEPTAGVASVVVRPDGKITMPLLKDIAVSGLTPSEAETMITEQLAKYIKAANVTVIVNQINSKKIFVVGGGIKKEGPLNFTYRMTVMQAISEAGGLSDYAKRKKIYVLRNENGRQYRLKFDYDAALKGEHMETNIPLIPGDTLVVPNH